MNSFLCVFAPLRSLRLITVSAYHNIAKLNAKTQWRKEKHYLFLFFLLMPLFSSSLGHCENSFAYMPVAHKGRFIPIEVYLGQEKEVLDAREIEDLLMLPSKRGEGEWLPLKMLGKDNLTLFPQNRFTDLQNAFKQWYFASLPEEAMLKRDQFTSLFLESYLKFVAPLNEMTVHYPSLYQLYAEVWYHRIPWLEIALTLYGTSLLLIGVSFFRKKWLIYGQLSFLSALLLHAVILGLRSYILARPPVSNMYETVVYVPWILAFASLGFSFFYRNKQILFAGALGAGILLLVLNLSALDQSLDTLQPVLNSQYWLIIHVLLVVGSYGLFALASLLGHLYLCLTFFRNAENPSLLKLSATLLQTIYIGVTLLILGTLLGGVWAAESWGRFWDWDPKESWALISICTYLAFIHAHTFRHIHHLGLAIGSILGFLSISFTWYGVNYILGTGLHSYGFGSGGTLYYYLFLFGEFLFLAIAILLSTKKRLPI